MEERKRMIKIVLYRVVLCIVLAIGTEWLAKSNFSEICAALRLELISNTYTVNEMTLFNCTYTEEGIISQNNDPQLEIPVPNTYVDQITLALKEPVGHSWQIQVFYTDAEQTDYSEEKSVVQWCSEYDDEITIPIEQNVDRIRIDLGNEENVTYAVDKITVKASIGCLIDSIIDDISILEILGYMLFYIGCMVAWNRKGEILRWYERNVRFCAGVVLLSLTLLRVWFGNYVGNWIDYPAPHDDQWFTTASQLNSYYSDSLGLGTRMLIKEMMFPYFLYMVRVLNISFATAVSLLWVLGAGLAGVLSYQLARRKRVSCIVYVYFLWCPIAFELRAGTRIYRNCVIAPSVLTTFCLALIFLFMLVRPAVYKKFQYILVAIALGIALFCTAYIKEDGMWLIACLIVVSVLYLSIAVYRFHKDKRHLIVMVCISLMPLLLFGGLQNAYKLLNYENFGVWVTNTRTDSELGEFVNNIYKIDSENRTKIVWAPKDAIEKAFEASQTLSEHPELLDRIIHSGWFAGDIDSNPIVGDFLSWVLRDALNECGLWTSYADVEEMFQCVNDELDEAFQTGMLKEDSKFQLVESAGGYSLEEIISLKDNTWKAIKATVTLDLYEPGATIMDSETTKELGFEQYATNTVLSYGSAYDIRVEEVEQANVIVEKIFIFYRWVQLAVIVVGLLGITQFIFKRKARQDFHINMWMLLSLVGLWILSFMYAFAISWFMTFINSSTWLIFYSSALVPMIYLAEMLGVLLFVKTFKVEKGEVSADDGEI